MSRSMLSARRSRRHLFAVIAVAVVAVTIPIGVSSAEPTTTPIPTPGVTQSSTSSTQTSSAMSTPAPEVESTTTQTSTAEPTPRPDGPEVERRPVETSTTPTQTTTLPSETTAPSVQPSTERTRPGRWKPTENPNATVKPGQMRSDREEIPGGFTKADADKAETLEAAKLQQSRTTSLTAGCQIYWPSPHQVCGAIKDKYNSLGGPNSFLLWPAQPEYRNPDNIGYRQAFKLTELRHALLQVERV